MTTVATVIFVLLTLHGVAAMRPLEGEEWLKKQVLTQSLQRGPVTPSGPNPCTHIPGRGSGVCTLNDMNVAGSVVHSPSAFPNLVVDVAVATSDDNNETRDPDPSS